MRSSVVVVVNVFLHDAMGVPFTQEDEVIQTFTSETSQEAFADGIGFRCTVGSAEYLNACPDGNVPERCPIFAVIVADQEARSISERCGLAQLLSQPFVRGVAGHPEVHDAAVLQFNDDENEDGAEEQVVGLEDITGPDLAGVVVDEGSPALLRRARVTDVFNVVLDRAFRSAQPQLQQLAMNAVGAPDAVLSSHALNEPDSLFR